MKSYLKLFVLIAVVAIGAISVSACSDDNKPASTPPPAPEPVKPNS